MYEEKPKKDRNVKLFESLFTSLADIDIHGLGQMYV